MKELNGNGDREVHSNIHSKVHSKITPAQMRVLEIIKTSPSITTKAISAQLGISTRMVANHLKALRDLNAIRRIGSRKSGYWEIVD